MSLPEVHRLEERRVGRLRAVTKAGTSSKRRWGYLIWVGAGIVIGAPEITAAVDSDALPFTTISGMTGHLERHHTWVELVVVSVICFVVYSTTRLRPQAATASETSAVATPNRAVGRQEVRESRASNDLLSRTAGGRLTVRNESAASARQSHFFDSERAPLIFAISAVASFAAVAAATWITDRVWPDPAHYHQAYVLYGSLAGLWIVAPSAIALVVGADVPYPTLFRTVANLEDWLRARSWPRQLGPVAAWLTSYVIFAGLVILLLHLTLYPFPDITRILNPNG